MRHICMHACVKSIHELLKTLSMTEIGNILSQKAKFLASDLNL